MGVKPVEALSYSGTIVAWQERDIEGQTEKCNIIGSCIEANSTLYVYVKDIQDNKGNILDGYRINISNKNFGIIKRAEVTNGTSEIVEFDNIGENTDIIIKAVHYGNQKLIDEVEITKHPELSCENQDCNLSLTSSSIYKVCAQIDQSKTEEYARCMDCFIDKNGVWTAVGCIPQDPKEAIKSIVQIGIGIAGGIVLIMILVGAFMFSTSQGDPNKTKEAKEVITSAIIGLIFIIFSVTMLQFIGVSILQIPGFGK